MGDEDRDRNGEEIIGLVESTRPMRAVGDLELSDPGSFLVGQQDALAALKRFKMKVAEQDSPFGARLLIYDRSWLGDLIAAVDHT